MRYVTSHIVSALSPPKTSLQSYIVRGLGTLVGFTKYEFPLTIHIFSENADNCRQTCRSKMALFRIWMLRSPSDRRSCC